MKILLVDLSGLFWRMWHATHDRRAYNKVLAALNRHWHNYDKVAVCLDGPPYVRSEWYPEYKANRPEKPEAAKMLLDELADTVINDNGFTDYICNGWEADDVIATLASAYKTEDVTILSADKDLQQCCALSDTIKWLSPKDGEEPIFAEHLPGLYGVYAENYTLYKALTGDASDNIPGVRGCGPSMAEAVVNHVCGSLSVLIDTLREKPETLPRYTVFALPGDIKNIQLWYKLVSLNYDLPIDVDRLVKDDAMEETKVEEELPTKVEGKLRINTVPEVVQLAPSEPVTNVEGRNFRNSLEPVSIEQAWKVAQKAYQSKLYPEVRGPEVAFMLIMKGREMGMGAETSLSTIHLLPSKSGPKMCVKTEVMLGLVNKSGLSEYVDYIETTAEKCTVETHKKGKRGPTSVTWTMADAKQQGLAGRGMWGKMPRVMLRWRATAELLRMEYPEVTQGVYGIEEMEEG